MISKRIFNAVFLSLLACVALNGCKDEVELPDQPVESFNKVYMPQSVNGPVSKVLLISDNMQTLVYGANFGGQGYPETDIAVNFAVDPEKAAAYNTANNTNYPLLPEASYTLSATEAIIPKGHLSTSPMHIDIKTKGTGAMDALKTFILPVTMTVSGQQANENLRTTYYILKAQPDLKDYPNFDRSAWKITGFSSEEATGEGPNNGRAIFALDGDANTFWHSRWSGGGAVPPHYIIIDLGNTKTLHGLGLTARQANGNGKPNEVNVQYSMDSTNWLNAGTVNFQDSQNTQQLFLPEGFNRESRYVKVTINTAYDASYMQVAELNLF